MSGSKRNSRGRRDSDDDDYEKEREREMEREIRREKREREAKKKKEDFDKMVMRRVSKDVFAQEWGKRMGVEVNAEYVEMVKNDYAARGIKNQDALENELNIMRKLAESKEWDSPTATLRKFKTKGDSQDILPVKCVAAYARLRFYFMERVGDKYVNMFYTIAGRPTMFSSPTDMARQMFVPTELNDPQEGASMAMNKVIRDRDGKIDENVMYGYIATVMFSHAKDLIVKHKKDILKYFKHFKIKEMPEEMKTMLVYMAQCEDKKKSKKKSKKKNKKKKTKENTFAILGGSTASDSDSGSTDNSSDVDRDAEIKEMTRKTPSSWRRRRWRRRSCASRTRRPTSWRTRSACPSSSNASTPLRSRAWRRFTAPRPAAACPRRSACPRKWRPRSSP